MPHTTPMPNETAKILIQKFDDAQEHLAPRREVQPFEHRDVRREPDRERRQQEVERDDEGELDAGEKECAFVHALPFVGVVRPL